MKMAGDKGTRRQGDKETARRAHDAASLARGLCPPRPLVALSPCPLVSSSLSPCLLVPLSSCPLVPPRRNGAFTLPEVLAALVLIGLVLPAVMKGVSLALAASDDARRRVEAVGLAENKLAEMTADAMSSQGSGGGSGDFGDEAPGYQWEATTASVDTSLTEISVRVTWTARGAERGVSLSTYAYAGTGTSTESTGATGPGGTP